MAEFIEALRTIQYIKSNGIKTADLSLTVRPAVWWVLGPLKKTLKHHYWAGLTECTKPFGFALSYVFDKQSGRPWHCDLLMHLNFSKHIDRHLFYRRYKANLPNSLISFKLADLCLLSKSTSASSRYGCAVFTLPGFHGL